MSEQTEIFNAMRDHNKLRKMERRQRGQSVIAGVLKDYSVEDMNRGYQFRVNRILDLYPTNSKYHNLKTNSRGFYPANDKEKFSAFIALQLSQAQEAPQRMSMKQVAASVDGGVCAICGKPAKRRLCDVCKGKPAHELTRKV